MSRIKKLILFGIILNGAASWAGVYFNKWATAKAALMADGRAELYFPYREYTLTELERMYPQIKNKYVPTTVTPEQTYAKFRQALKDNDLEGAVEQMSKEDKNYKKNVEDLTTAYKAEKFGEIYHDYLEQITAVSQSETISQFYFNYTEGNQQKTHFINFAKNNAGVWKMSSL